MVINEGLKIEQFACVWLILSLCVSTCWLLMPFFPTREHELLPGTWTYVHLATCARPCICAYVCACSSQIHRDHVKDCVSYRCKPWTSGWHISNAQKGRRGGAKPQRRAVPQSLNSGGLWGGDQDCTTTAYTCSLHVCLPTKQYSSTMCSCSAMATHRKNNNKAKKADIWSQSRPQRFISSERGIPVYAFRCIIFMAKANHWWWNHKSFKAKNQNYNVASVLIHWHNKSEVDLRTFDVWLNHPKKKKVESISTLSHSPDLNWLSSKNTYR